MLTLLVLGLIVALIPGWQRLERFLVRRAYRNDALLERNADGILVPRRVDRW